MCPSAVYAMIGFLRHERRQEWVRLIVESRLGGSGSELARKGSFGHPEGEPGRGEFPGEPQWEYYFHGRGCCFTHQDGTTLDVDFADDGSALDIDPYFYTHYLETVAKPGWCERKLRRPAGFEDAWKFDLEQLELYRVISKEWRFRLTEEGRDIATSLESLTERLPEASGDVKTWIFCLLNDFDSAVDVSVEKETLLTLREHQKAQRAGRAAMLAEAIGKRDDVSHAQSALQALGSMGESVSYELARASLFRTPVTGLNHAAYGILKTWSGSRINRCFAQAFAKMTKHSSGWFRKYTPSESDRPRLGLIVSLAEELLRRHDSSDLPVELRSSMVTALQRDCLACNDDAGFLLFLLDSDKGLEKFRRNLASTIPVVRSGSAVFLAMIGGRQAIDMLIRASHRRPDRGGHEAACVLSLLDAEQARQAASEWLRRNDGYEDAEGEETELFGRVFRTWSMEEVMRSNMREDLAYSFDGACKKFTPLLEKWKSQREN